MAKERKSLGRGLASIITNTAKKEKNPLVANIANPTKKDIASFSNSMFSEVLLDKIVPSKYQARKEFSEIYIDELAESISSEGLMQPIVLRKLDDGFYEIIAGERRWRACKKLGWKRIPSNVQNASDSSAAVKGLIENLQRSDLNPMEESMGYASLMTNFKLTQEEIAKRLGKARSSIANSLRLLSLPKEIQNYISSGLLSIGHAKVLLGVSENEQKLILARKVVELQMSVRLTEEAANKIKYQQDRSSSKTQLNQNIRDAVIKQIEDKLRERLNANIEVKQSNKKGKIIIDYLDNQDLERILEIIGVKL